MIEEMVCHALGHKWQDKPLSMFTEEELKQFQSPRAIAVVKHFDDEEKRHIVIEYCTRCKVWEIKEPKTPKLLSH